MNKSIVLILILLLTNCIVGEIEKNKCLTTAIIYDKRSGAKGGFSLLYKFYINKKLYFGRDSKKYHCQPYSYFHGKTVHVVFSFSDPEKNILLLDEEDYKQWKIIMPDSMKWLKNCD